MNEVNPLLGIVVAALVLMGGITILLVILKLAGI